MANDGLHLFLNAIHNTSDDFGIMKDAFTFFVKKMIESEKTGEKDKNEEQEINAKLMEVYNKLVKKHDGLDTESFEFKFPEYSAETWAAHIKTKYKTNLVDGVHYKEDNGTLFYNDNDKTFAEDGGDEGELKTWKVLKKSTDNDNRTEDSLLRYADKERQKPEWHAALQNLKEYGEHNGYDNKHFKLTLDRWISWFEPSLQTITSKQTSNEIAKLLLSMYKPKSRFETLQKDMLELTRNPGDDLTGKLSLLRALATAMYEDFKESERLANVDRILLHGLLQFTSGTTRKNAELAMEFERRQGRPLVFDQLLKGCLDSERVYGKPTETLTYNGLPRKDNLLYMVNTNPPKMVQGVKGPPNLVSGMLPGSSNNKGKPYRTILDEKSNFDRQMDISPPADPNVERLSAALADLTTTTRFLPSEQSTPAVSASFKDYRNPRDPTDSGFRKTHNSSSSADDNSYQSMLIDETMNDAFEQEKANERPPIIPNPSLDRRTSQRETKAPDRFQAGVNYVVLDPKTSEVFLNYVQSNSQRRRQSPNRRFYRNRSNSRNYQNNYSNRSRDRNTRYRNNSYDRNPSRSPNRSRSNSRPRYNRSFSRGRDPRNNRRNSPYNGYKGTDRRPEYWKNRSNSRNRNRSNSRNRYPNRDSNRSYSSDNDYNRNNYRNSRPQSRDNNRRFQSRSPQNRNKSYDSRMIKRGENCSYEYNPDKEKKCTKCATEGSHHEFECKRYHRYARYVCSNCRKGNHFSDECNSIPRNRSNSRDRNNSRNRSRDRKN